MTEIQNPTPAYQIFAEEAAGFVPCGVCGEPSLDHDYCGEHTPAPMFPFPVPIEGAYWFAASLSTYLRTLPAGDRDDAQEVLTDKYLGLIGNEISGCVEASARDAE